MKESAHEPRKHFRFANIHRWNYRNDRECRNRRPGKLQLRAVAKHVPELQSLRSVSTLINSTPMDSSDMDPDAWRKLVRIISNNYNQYTGFVILHGTDTMAYTASALSFMLEGAEQARHPNRLATAHWRAPHRRQGKPADQHQNSHRPPLQRTAHRTRSLHLLRKPPDARQPYHQNERGELQCFPFLQLSGTRFRRYTY